MMQFATTHSRDIKIDGSRTKSLHLIGYNPHKRPPRKQKTLNVSISTKFGYIMFSKSAVIAMNMSTNFIKIYYDSVQNVVAWRIQNVVSLEEMKLGWKLIRVQKKGHAIISMKSVLQTMNLTKDSYKKLEVKKYKDYSMLGSDYYYYVEIK